MENSKQKINQAAKCVQYHLETEGKEFKLKDIKNIIKDKNLLDIANLKKLVEETVQTEEKYEVLPNSRRQIIEGFMKDNWELIKNNNVIKNVLLSSYCQGRLTKEQREAIKEDVLSRLEGDEDVPVEVEEEETLAQELLGDDTEYDF